MRFLVKAASITGGFLIAVIMLPSVATANASGPVLDPRTDSVGQSAVIPPSAHLIGPLSSSTQIHFDVFLKPRDPSALAAAVQAISDPNSPEYHQFIGPGQFGPLFGPTPSTISSVRSALTASGLNLGKTSPNGLTIPVTATAALIQSSLHIRMAHFNVSGRSAYANQGAPRLPASISGSVQAVTGLDTVNVPRPESISTPAIGSTSGGASGAKLPTAPAGSPGPSSPSSQSSSSATGIPVPHTSGPSICSAGSQGAVANSAWTAAQLASAYGFNTAYANGDLGAGQTIALYEEEPYAVSDVQGFEQCYGISSTVTPVNVDGGPAAGFGQGEAILDIDNVISMAPAATVLVYQGPPGSSTDIWSKIVNDDTAKVVSTSWGNCELNEGLAVAQAENTVFSQAAMQGQTIFDAAGDAGSEDCLTATNPDTSLAVDDPGSQPDITTVGGTSLSSVTPRTETVWNNCLNQGTSCQASSNGGAGGGGISTFWPMPSWQAGAGVINSYSSGTPCGSTTKDCRQVPDVSASADSNFRYLNYFKGGWTGTGGTSGAAPLWAALTALADEACGSPSGLINPTLYSLATSHPQDFNDITTGNNDVTNTNNGAYPATANYDMASGLGTPTSSLFLPGALCGTAQPPGTGAGYWMLSSDGTVYQFGAAINYGSANGIGTAAGIAPESGGTGYWVVSTSGTVRAFGSAATLTLSANVTGTVVSIAATPDGKGFWLATSVGQIVTAGDAKSFGSPSASGLTLNSGIANMAVTPDGLGYWLLGGDGGIFSYGDAAFYGSTGQINPTKAPGGSNGVILSKPVVGLVPTIDSKGYWMVATDGGIFAFGDATFLGSSGQIDPTKSAGGSNSFVPAKPINGMVSTADGGGYWMVAADGGVFAFGDAGFVGSLGNNPPATPIVAFAPS
ncbi:MAG TPA: protease pro-enzyme activation domain-containing protein [Acidimicrobiales bacterium]|nr:protease pro-enzyme activation domain-containing protein [Acidimicrobiales bacterium]